MNKYNLQETITFITLFFLLCIVCCPTVSGKEQSDSSQDFSIIAEKTLSETWTRIIKHNFSDSSTDKEWEKIYKEARPHILKSRSSRELINLINQMISRLGQSHIHLMPPMSRSEKKAIKVQLETRKSVPASGKGGTVTAAQKKDPLSAMKGKPADPGLRLIAAGDKLCVLDVIEGSSAAAAGVKMGDVISSIHGFKFDLSKYSDTPWEMIAEGMLAGNYGTKVSVIILNKEGIPREIILERKCITGNWIQLGAMPKIQGKVEYKILKGNIGYIFITPCFPRQVMRMHKIISNHLKECRGLIIDIRSNPGGMMLMAQGMAGWLSDKELEMGTMKTREYPLQMKSYPQKRGFRGPLAVLINKGTFSTAEVFAAGIKDNKRGRLFGETTGGKCLPSLFFVLSTGYRLQTVLGDFVRINGKRIERLGVVPDVSVHSKQEDLVSGIDTVCESARKWLMNQTPIDK
jgi:carboxyl-terminal processing protease